MVCYSKKGGDSGMNIEERVNELQLELDSIKKQLKAQCWRSPRRLRPPLMWQAPAEKFQRQRWLTR